MKFGDACLDCVGKPEGHLCFAPWCGCACHRPAVVVPTNPAEENQQHD